MAPSVGGGWVPVTGQLGDGVQGEYFNNSTLSGTPAFTRMDDRIDFTYTNGNAYVGGSPDPSFSLVGPTNWSAKWTGTLTANFSETYTFQINSAANGVRLWVTPVGQSQGSPLINDWTNHGQTTDKANMALKDGQSYNVEIDFSEITATMQQVQFQWSSPSTPLEDIEPMTPVGVNVDGGDALFANMVNGGTRSYWWSPTTGQTVPVDSNDWPTADAEIFLGEGDQTTEAGGSYLVQFNGEAQVTNWPQNVDWIVNGTDLHSATLPFGAGYNAATNTTTATMVVPASTNAGFYLSFTHTTRNPNGTAAGITNLYVMQPTTLGGNTPIPVGTLFTPSALAMLSQYTALRCVGPADAIGNLTSNWSDRTTVGDNFWSGWMFNGGNGVTANVDLNNGFGNAGVPWEVMVALANEAGKDIYISLPILVSPNYLTNLADLFAYGSDGVNPYTSVQSDPVWKPLNPNLKVYIELSDETWNSGYSASESNIDGWANQLSQRALYDFLTNNQNDPLYPGGSSAYNDGAILASYYDVNSSNDSSFLSTYNANAAESTSTFSPQYFSNSGSINGFYIGQGWVGLRLVQVGNDFKATFNETGIDAADTNSRVRPLFEWQYGGNWDAALPFISGVYGSQHPVNYYLYGGGGAVYADDTTGGFTDVSFENPSFTNGLTGWTANGSAGVVADGSSMGNPASPPLFSPIAITNGATESGNTVTITTAQPHDFQVGQSVVVSDVPVAGYNGTFTITSVTATTFTYQDSVTGLVDTGTGMVNGTSGSGQTAYLQPGASLSQSVTFSGGYADITFYAAQNVPGSWLQGLMITLTPTNGGPAINGGQPIAVAEGQNDGPGYFAGNQNSFSWERSQAFYTGTSAYTYTVTFSNMFRSGTCFIDGLAVQTVNGMFNETNDLTAGYTNSPYGSEAPSGLDVSYEIQEDVTLASQYGLHDVAYEGGFDFNQNLDSGSPNGYESMGWRGFSSAEPNVGAYANLDLRTEQLAINTLDQFYAAGGTLAVETESSGNPNSWAVATPTYYNYDTPKLQAVAAVEQTQQAATYGLAPGQSPSWYWIDSNASDLPSELNAVFLVPKGYYGAQVTFNAYNSPAPTQPETVEILVGGGPLSLPQSVISTVSVPTTVSWGQPFTATIPVGLLPAGQYSLEVYNVSASGTPALAVASYTLTVNQAPAITSASNTTFTVGSAGSFTVTASGSSTPSLTESGALPSGVTFVDNSDGTATLSGTPAAGTCGSYTLSFTASNGVGSNATQTFTLTIDQAPAITSANNVTFTVGSAGSFTVTTTDFPIASLSESGTLPSGVTFADNHNGTATLSGTPAAGTNGTYNLTFTASNGVGSNATQSFTLTVNQATFLSSDTTTKGTWKGHYGSDGYNIIGNQASYPSYANVTTSGTKTYVWKASTADVRGLQVAQSGSTNRTAACWYSSSGQFTVDVNLTDGQAHRVSIYACDWDSTNRSERIEVVDPTTHKVLDSRTISSFHGGVYLSWQLNGHVQLVFTRLSGANPVVSGIFFDTTPQSVPAAPTNLTAPAGNSQVTLNWTASSGATSYNIYRSTTSGGEGSIKTGVTATSFTDTGLTNGTTYFYQVTAVNSVGESGKSAEASATPAASSASATFIRSDTTTQGTWQGHYGSDGYDIIGNQANVPTYATVTPVGQSFWTWAGSTNDARALQKASTGATDRIASCWYASGQFSVDINLTDSQSHTVSLYALDWDSYNRSEQVDVVDANSGAVLDSRILSSFNGGTYLTWSLKGHIQLRFTTLGGANAVVSGLFFG